MKTLALVTRGMPHPEDETLRRLELADEYPRITLFQDRLNADIVDDRYLKNIPVVRQAAYRLLPDFAASVLEAYHLRSKYDAIISWSESLGIPFALLLKLTNVRVPHVALFSWISPSKKARLLKIAHSHIDRLILMNRVQEDFAVNTLGIPTSKVVLIKYAVDQKFWRPMHRETEMICSPGREMRDHEILLEALKGLDIRCHVTASTVRDMPDLALSVDGAAHPTLTVGRLSFTELRSLYARSRFVVVPLHATDSDQGTTVILEAMSMGKAVICSRTEGQVELIEEGKTGIFVPPGDARALREAIQFLWSHPEEAERMGHEGRERIEQFHTLEGFFSKFRNVVEEAIDEHQG